MRQPGLRGFATFGFRPIRGQQELVMRAGQPSRMQPIELEHAFEMREQYLDLHTRA
jgi:hypothetical protein